MTRAKVAGKVRDMKLRPDQPRLSTEDRCVRQADRLVTIRLRMAIARELEERGITTPAAMGEALGMPPSEAVKLLTSRIWRGGDVALLETVADRMGVQVPAPSAANSRTRSRHRN